MTMYDCVVLFVLCVMLCVLLFGVVFWFSFVVGVHVLLCSVVVVTPSCVDCFCVFVFVVVRGLFVFVCVVC